jgi:SAM-dependent methyltransferase
MDNYSFCADFAARHANGPILDYGCGRGEIVSLLRKKGASAYGCDVYYDAAKRAPPDEIKQYVRPMRGHQIDFPDAFFDVVVNNQVIEHVPDLNLALGEISRVLKPGGLVLSLFPHKGVWREGHCGIPFLHWFPKGTRGRIHYARILRSIGLGATHPIPGTNAMQWSERFCEYLDSWTHYRTYTEIQSAFHRSFGELHHIESDWLDARLGGRIKTLPAPIKTFAARKLAGLAFWCRKS